MFDNTILACILKAIDFVATLESAFDMVVDVSQILELCLRTNASPQPEQCKTVGRWVCAHYRGQPEKCQHQKIGFLEKVSRTSRTHDSLLAEYLDKCLNVVQTRSAMIRILNKQHHRKRNRPAKTKAWSCKQSTKLQHCKRNLRMLSASSNCTHQSDPMTLRH